MTVNPKYDLAAQPHALPWSACVRHELDDLVGLPNGTPKDPIGNFGRSGGMDAKGTASTSVAVTVAKTVDALLTYSVRAIIR